MSEHLDNYDLLRGRKARLHDQFVSLRKAIQDITPQISIDDIGVMQEGSTITPRIKPELIDHAEAIVTLGRKLLTVQDELTRTNQEIIKARQAYYEESGELVRDV
jgi:hypothetical protein